jgi:hypothetical protein
MPHAPWRATNTNNCAQHEKITYDTSARISTSEAQICTQKNGTFATTYKSVVGKPIRDSLLGRQGVRSEYNTTIGLTERDWIDWFQTVISCELGHENSNSIKTPDI